MGNEEGRMKKWGREDGKMEYKVVFRKVKHPRIELKTGEVVVIVPYGEKPEGVVKRHEKWIKNKIKFIEECLMYANKVKLFERKKSEFKRLLTLLIQKLCEELQVKINKVIIKRMKTKWASVSKNKNLTINTLMKFLPYHLIKYIIYHELTHLIVKRHNENFWNIISRKFKNYKNLEKELFIYWFLICRKMRFPSSKTQILKSKEIHMKNKYFGTKEVS